jgi:hypothetical protein
MNHWQMRQVSSFELILSWRLLSCSVLFSPTKWRRLSASAWMMFEQTGRHWLFLENHPLAFLQLASPELHFQRRCRCMMFSCIRMNSLSGSVDFEENGHQSAFGDAVELLIRFMDFEHRAIRIEHRASSIQILLLFESPVFCRAKILKRKKGQELGGCSSELGGGSLRSRAKWCCSSALASCLSDLSCCNLRSCEGV